MKIKIIKHINGFQIENIDIEVNTRKEMERIMSIIISDIDRKKSEVISKGLCYQEVKEGNYYGFISDTFQVIQSSDNIDVQDENEHVQYVFASDGHSVAMEMNAEYQIGLAA